MELIQKEEAELGYDEDSSSPEEEPAVAAAEESKSVCQPQTQPFQQAAEANAHQAAV